jgi:exoribonuclease-2
MAFISTFDGLDIVGFRIEEAVVQVDSRLTYEDVDGILEWAEHPMSSTVEALMTLADEIREQRRRGGAITLDRGEVSVHVSDGEVQLERYRTDDPARRLVSELMILSCSETAIWCQERGIPAMYRSQQAPEETPRIPLDRPMAGFELQRVLRTLRRATLRAEPAPHAGLGVECYTQVTSPLRRYADLLMHRQIKNVLRTGTPRYSKDDLCDRFDHLEAIASSQRQVERHSRRYFTLKRLESIAGTRVEGEVIRQIGRRWLVDLVEYGVQAPWSPGRAPQLGDEVTVKLKTVDARRDKLTVS